jgi:hypothetical protein
MHFSTLFISLSALAATSIAIPASEPITEAPPVPATMVELGKKIPIPTTGAFAGSLRKNFAKIWVYTGLKCGEHDGPSHVDEVWAGEDRCFPYRNVGSVIAWYKSPVG